MTVTPKFSQATRHEKPAEKTATSPSAAGVSQPSDILNVTLIRNPEMSCHACEKMPSGIPSEAFIKDCASLSKTALRQRYPREASTHKNMLSRQQIKGAVIHPDFLSFDSFLRAVGPMPAQGATLDRIENTDPEYGPGKVRWADKRTQNNNKSDTIILNYSRTGETYTTSRLSKLQGVSPATIRKRLERGWTDDEIIEGKRLEKAVSDVSPNRKYIASVPAEKSASEIAFEREAQRFASYRERWNEEAVMASYEDTVALGEGLQNVTREQYARKFARHWPDWRPHVCFDRLPLSQQQLIAEIDPTYVAGWKRTAAAKAEIAKAL